MDIRETLQIALEHAIMHTQVEIDKTVYANIKELLLSGEQFMCEKVNINNILNFGRVFTNSKYQYFQFKYYIEFIEAFYSDEEIILIPK